MHLKIEVPDALGVAAKAQAQAEGVSHDIEAQSSSKPYETGYGMLAKYGPAPSAEDIDENRRETSRNFAQES